MFIRSNKKHELFNIGGGPANTISLLEFIQKLEKLSNKKMEVRFSDWRPSDQKVYISDIKKIKKNLGWEPKVGITEGIKRLIVWVSKNKSFFI